MLKKNLLLVGFLIFICLSGLAVYIFTSGSTENPRSDKWDNRDIVFVLDLEFIDGGSGNDTIIATAINRANEPLTITSGYVSQSYWLDKGFVYQNHEQSAKLFGDLTIPINGTQDIHLSLPKDTLIPGKSYAVELNTTQQHRPSVQYMDSPNSFNVISAPETFTFYHMLHPNSPGPIEEGIIIDLAASIIHLNYLDSFRATVQNTGDTEITIAGGFVNGMAAINATKEGRPDTGPSIIQKNFTGEVHLQFPADSYLLDQEQNKIPFNVKILTAEGNIIEYPEKFYYGGAFVAGRIKEPVVFDEKALITSLEFIDGGAGADSIAVTLHNMGAEPIIVTSGMLNGRATTTELLHYIIDGGSTTRIVLQLKADTLVQGTKYQVVLISSQNNAFIQTSTYSLDFWR